MKEQSWCSSRFARRLCALCLVLLWTVVASAEEPAEWVDENLADLVEVYRHFHQHPELSFHEEQTAARLTRELAASGYDVTTEVGGLSLIHI